MKHVVLSMSLALVPLAAHAEEDRGLSLMERGAQLFFDGLLRELDPALREFETLLRDMEPAFRSFAEEMGPAFRDLLSDVEDWSAYHPPEILPNGDIILRRKAPDERGVMPELPQEPEVEI